MEGKYIYCARGIDLYLFPFISVSQWFFLGSLRTDLHNLYLKVCNSVPTNPNKTVQI